MAGTFNISLIADVQHYFRDCNSLPSNYVLTEEDYLAVEKCHKQWIKDGGVQKNLLGKEEPVRSVMKVMTKETKSQPTKRASYMYRDKKRVFIPRSMLPEIMALLPGAVDPRASKSTAPASRGGGGALSPPPTANRAASPAASRA